MTIKTTRWRTDTCDCVVTYTWDDTTPVDSRVHTLKEVEQRCVDHAGLSNAQVWTALRDENSRQSRILQTILNNFPTWKRTVTDLISGTTYDEILPGKRPTITWDKPVSNRPRVIRVNIPGRTALERTALQNLADAAFGAGKVTVV